MKSIAKIILESYRTLFIPHIVEFESLVEVNFENLYNDTW